MAECTNFLAQAEVAGKIHARIDRKIRERHKGCPNFKVVHDAYFCGPGCLVHLDLVADAALAAELVPADELEEFADEYLGRNDPDGDRCRHGVHKRMCPDCSNLPEDRDELAE